MSTPELQQADNGTWYIHWSEGRRSKRISTRTRDLAAAKSFFGTWLLMEQSATSKSPNNLTIAELWALWRGDKPAVDEKRLAIVWEHLRPVFGHLTVPQVGQNLVDSYVLRRGVSPGTVWLELTKLVACMNHGVKKRLLASTDIPILRLPSKPTRRERWLREDEASRLFDAAAALRKGDRLSRVERFLWLALETGARKEAIVQLRWSQVDFEIGVVHYLRPGERQTSKRKVSVAISRALLPVLRRAYEERTGDFVLDGLGRVYNELETVARTAGVSELTPHVLRHTAATWMLRRGVSLWDVAQVLGNSAKVVEQTYGHHCPSTTRAAVDAISAGRLRVVGE